MKTDWHAVLEAPKSPARDASLADRATIIVRMGQLILSAGTGAWRVRDTMNRVAMVLGVVVHVDISLVSLEVTCIDGTETETEVVANAGTGVNTTKIMHLEQLLHTIEEEGADWTVGEFHKRMDDVEKNALSYKPWQTGVAAAFACASFVFLLSGGPIEMLCAFFGAGFGQWLRAELGKRHYNPLVAVACGVCIASLVYIGALNVVNLIVHGATDHAAGYVGAILFVIPGFPLITSGLDFFKGEMRSGIERLGWALAIIIAATSVAWLVAEFLHLSPDDFTQTQPDGVTLTALRFLFSFIGVFGFSIMFNSRPAMAAVAGGIGCIANTLRLSLIDFAAVPAEAAAFLGALCAGLLAATIGRRFGFPRITTTVPSIVIMVPGLYMYRAMYMMGIFETGEAANWLVRAVMIVLFLPVGLITARVLTDRRWRLVS
jgi:uncharacterized membrane protein YjjP (DUF1212 family)